MQHFVARHVDKESQKATVSGALTLLKVTDGKYKTAPYAMRNILL